MKKLLAAVVAVLMLCACAPSQKLTLERRTTADVYFSEHAETHKFALGTDGKLYIGGSYLESDNSGRKNPPAPLTQRQIDELPAQILPYLAEDNQIQGIYNWKAVAEDVVDFYIPGPVYYLTKDGKLFVSQDKLYKTAGVPVLLAENVVKICRTYPVSYITEDGSLMMQTDAERYVNIEGAKTSTGVSGHALVKLAGNAYDASSWGNRNFAYIDLNGNLWVNGYNDFGTFANGKYDEVLGEDYSKKEMAGTPIAPDGYSYTKFYKAFDKVREVSVSGNNIFVIRDDGSLWGWGANEYGNVGVGSHGDGDAATRDVITKPQKVLDNVVKLQGGLTGSCDPNTGENAFMALTADGTLYSWGSNRNGVLANGEMSLERSNEFLYADRPTEIFTDVKDFTYKLGYPGFMVLKNDGSVYVWGYSADGGIGTGVKAENTVQARYEAQYFVGTPTKIMDDGAYLNNLDGQLSVIKTDGSIWTWGKNPFGWILYTERSFVDDPTNIWEASVFPTPVRDSYISADIAEDGTVSFHPTPVE